MRVVITGAGGQLGRSLETAFADLLAIPLFRSDLDVADEASSEALRRMEPDLVLHAAAFTDVEGCETDPEHAFRVNAEGTRHVAEACARSGAILVYPSTDYIFNGEQEIPYAEDADPSPLNVYGESKLAGEGYVRDALQEFYIVRTAWLYGPGHHNFVEKVLRLAAENDSVEMTTGELGSPTYSRDLAAAIRRLVDEAEHGTYHLTNQGACSRFEWAREILDLAGQPQYPVRPTDTYLRRARVPRRAVLANLRAKALGIELRPWQEGLRDYVEARSLA